MLKLKLIVLAVKIIMGAIALGLGIWYLSSSIGGEALTYTSMDNFLNAVGVENGDIATANGCFMCGYNRNDSICRYLANFVVKFFLTFIRICCKI